MINPANRIHTVDQFYNVLWNADDRVIAPRLLHPQLQFRGAIGAEAHGIDGFLGYMDRMLATFPDFHTDVENLVCGEDGLVVSKQLYTGTHQGAFFEVPPTCRKVAYTGIGFFEFEGELIRKIWVLGDLLNLYKQFGWTPAPTQT